MKKIFLWSLGLVAALLLLAVALLPTYLSTSSGKEFFVEQINHRIPGHLSIDELKLSWLNGQAVTRFSLLDPEGKEIIAFDHLKTNTSLFYLLFGGRHFDRVVLEKPYASLEQTEKGSNLEKALGKKWEKKPQVYKKERHLHFDELLINDGEVIITPEKVTPIKISNIQVEKKQDPESFHFHAKTLQQNIEGEILVHATFEERTNMKANIVNFPIAILDQLSESKIFTQAFGDTLNATVDLQKQRQKLDVALDLESTNLKAVLKGTTENEELHLSPDSQLTFTLTPIFFQSLVTPSERHEWTLANKATINAKIEKAILPFKLAKPDLKKVVLQVTAVLDRAELCHEHLGGYSLNDFAISLISKENIEIAYQGGIKGKEASEISGTISLTPDRKILFTTHNQGFPVSLLEIVAPAVAQNLRALFGSTFDLDGSGTFIEEELDADFSVQSLPLQIKGKLRGKNPDFKFDVEGNKTITGQSAKIVGSSIQLNVQGDLELHEKGVCIPVITGKFENPYLHFDLNGKIGEKDEPFSYKQVHLVANGVILQLPLVQEYPIKNGSFLLHFDGAKNLINGKAEASFNEKNSEIDFEVKDFIKDEALCFDSAVYMYQADLEGFPLALVAPFFPAKANPVLLIGENATVKANGTYSPQGDPRAFLEVLASADGFQASISIAIDKNLKVTQNQPSHIHWDMTPERYRVLLAMTRPTAPLPPYLLAKEAPVDFTITQFICSPLSPREDLNRFLCHSGLVGEMSIGNLIFRSDQTQDMFSIEEVQGSVKGERFFEAIDVNLNGHLITENVPDERNSLFTFSGQVLNMWTPEGKFNRPGVTLKGEMNLELLPVRQITGIVPMNEKVRTNLQAALGELINARIYGEVSQQTGPVTIDVKASNFKALLPLQLTPQAIYLRDFVNAELTLTPEINEAFLKDLNPLFITGAYSDRPLRVFIDPTGFVWPIHPFFFQGIRIEKAILDIGKITIRNGGQIQSLMEFLKATPNITADGLMDGWFTPIFMSLNNGVASYKRFDALLANSVHIALWGNINLVNHQVDMTLGIAPMTLKQRFNILGLSKKEMFQVKMKGTTDKLDLDWSSAYTRIGILIARTAGGHIGYIIGGIVEQIVELGEAPTPPQTTDPFPWEQPDANVYSPEIPQESPPPRTKKGLRKFLQFLIP